MKKNYSKPIVLVETFTPNQFVAACNTDVVYTLTGIGGTCNFAFDVSPLHVWDSQEDDQGDKHIDPHGGTLLFTPEAVAKARTIMDGSHSLCWYNSDKKALQAANGNNPQGYILGIESSAMNAAQAPNGTPIEANSISEYSHGGGTGVFVFNITENFVKNQS